MNPMSLLTLPVSTLQLAVQNAHRASPCGERLERRIVSWALGGMLAALGLGILLF